MRQLTITLAMIMVATQIAHAGGSGINTQPSPNGIEMGLECEAEAAAFTKVAELAFAFRDSDDVFAVALSELRNQLLDCLVVSSDEENESSFSWLGEQGSLSGTSQQLKI